MRDTEFRRSKTNVMVPALLKITGPLDKIDMWNTIVITIIEGSKSSMYLTNHEDQYTHVRIPINFIDSCARFTKESNNKCTCKLCKYFILEHFKASKNNDLGSSCIY